MTRHHVRTFGCDLPNELVEPVHAGRIGSGEGRAGGRHHRTGQVDAGAREPHHPRPLPPTARPPPSASPRRGRRRRPAAPGGASPNDRGADGRPRPTARSARWRRRGAARARPRPSEYPSRRTRRAPGDGHRPHRASRPGRGCTRCGWRRPPSTARASASPSPGARRRCAGPWSRRRRRRAGCPPARTWARGRRRESGSPAPADRPWPGGPRGPRRRPRPATRSGLDCDRGRDLPGSGVRGIGPTAWRSGG